MPKGHLHPTQEHRLDSTFPSCKGCKAPRKQRMAARALWHQSARPSGLSSQHPVPAPCASSPQAATLPVSVPTAASRHISTSSPSPAQQSLVSLQLPDCTTNGPHNKALLPADCSPEVSSDVHWLSPVHRCRPVQTSLEIKTGTLVLHRKACWSLV